MLTLVSLSYSWAADMNWDPDIKLEDCLTLKEDLSIRHSSLSLSCGVNDDEREKEYMVLSSTLLFNATNEDALIARLKNEIWLEARKNVTREPHNLSEYYISRMTAQEIVNRTSEILTEAKAVMEKNSHISNEVQYEAGDISNKLATSRGKLAYLGKKQILMFQLNNISAAILEQMNVMNKCSIKLAQVGEGLFLSGERGRGKEVLKECDGILNDKLKNQVGELNNLRMRKSQSRRRLSLVAELYGKKSSVIIMPECLREAGYSGCQDVEKCRKENIYLLHEIETECLFFISYVRAHLTLIRAEHLGRDVSMIQAWLKTVDRQSNFLKETSTDCADDADKLYSASYSNIQTLVKVAKCGALAIEKWDHIVEVCLEANNWSKIYFPFYNVVTLVNRWNCLRMWNAIIAISISLGSSFLLMSLLMCVCKVCWRKQKPYVLPVHVGKSRDRYLADESISRRLGNRNRMTSETMALEDVRKKESLSQVAR